MCNYFIFLFIHFFSVTRVLAKKINSLSLSLSTVYDYSALTSYCVVLPRRPHRHHYNSGRKKGRETKKKSLQNRAVCKKEYNRLRLTGSKLTKLCRVQKRMQ